MQPRNYTVQCNVVLILHREKLNLRLMRACLGHLSSQAENRRLCGFSGVIQSWTLQLPQRTTLQRLKRPDRLKGSTETMCRCSAKAFAKPCASCGTSSSTNR